MTTKGKIKLSRIDPVPESQMVMRVVSLREETANTESRSVEVVIATENPVERYDDQRDQIVNEVLTMDGVELRGGKNQLPIVDSHDRSTVANVLGSVRNVRTEGDELVGEAFFASNERSQEAYLKLREGHLTDFSITAIPRESFFVERGQTYTTRRGDVVNGPAVIVTRWTPTDASICATGADERSVVRRSYNDLTERKREMDQSLIDALVSLGMPADLTDPNTMVAWVVGNLNASMPESAEPIENAEPPIDEAPVEDPPAEEEEVMKAEEDPAITEEEIKKTVDRALKADGERRREILASCKKLGIERAFADELCENRVPLDVARQKIIDRKANPPIGTTTERANAVNVTKPEADKFYEAARDGLVQRALKSTGSRRDPFEGRKPAEGHDDFEYCSLNRLAETFVERMGVNTKRMSPKDVALVAMGHPGTINRFNIQREAYHSTGSFPNLLLDAANKTLLAGYEEAPYTWSTWARQAQSVADFKNINRIKFSEMASPEMVPERGDYPDAAMSDQKETYKVEKYGSVFTISWETVVNDDLDAISRIPQMQGAACRRKQNAAVYGVLTANAKMADTGTLFNATAQTTAGGHANLATGAGAPSVTTLNAAYLSMMTKKGINSSVILNIQPSFIIVPAAVGATALQLLGSIADPAVGGSAAGNSNTLNIYGPNGSRPLKVIIEPVLDASSITAWYLAASSTQVDTVELTFLQGEETPVLENEWDFDHDVYKYKVRQTFGVAAIDFRGLYKHAGA